MANGIKYQAHEILNKVLNAAETGLQVDIVAGAEYAEDAAHTDEDTGNFVLGVRNDTLGTLGGTNGDYVPFQMNASGALYVEIATGGSSDAVHVDDAAFTLGSHKGMMMMGFAGTQSVGSNDAGAIAMETDGSVHIHDGGNTITVDGTVTANLGTTDNAVLDAVAASLSVLDDWDDSNYANVNMNLAGSDAQAGEGTISATTQRVTIATDDDGVAHLATIAGDTTSVDGKITACNTGAVVLAAGSAAIGKLAANDGVDIGDVDVTSVVPGYGATNLGKREDDAHSNLDTGVMALAVRNDAIAAIGAADGDYAPLQVNSAGSLYTKDETGEAGSILVKGTNAVAAGISGTVFIAIQFLEDTVFHDDDGLVASSTQLYPDDAGVGSDISSNGGNTDDVVFPQGMTIFGRWAGFKLASGTVIAYVGYV